MKSVTRRDFVRNSVAAGAAVSAIAGPAMASEAASLYSRTASGRFQLSHSPAKDMTPPPAIRMSHGCLLFS